LKCCIFKHGISRFAIFPGCHGFAYNRLTESISLRVTGAWPGLADGYADTPPTALKHPTAQVVAPLTMEAALVGRHGAAALSVTPREVNRFVAFAASGWIAGPTADVVRQALIDCRDSRH
jgi:hypothetical protein